MIRHDQDVDTERPRPIFVIVSGLVAFGVLLGVWIALAGQPDTQDLLAGSVGAFIATTVGYFVSHRGRFFPGFKAADLMRLAALPRQVVVEGWRVFAVVANKAAKKEVPSSGWKTVTVDTGHASGGWPAARRDAVLTVLMSASPNTIVADLDTEAGTALIHELVAGAGAVTSLPPVDSVTPGNRGQAEEASR